MPLLHKLVRKGLLMYMPESIKKPFRKFINPESLYDKELLSLGLDDIRDTDIFLCSYPKSGNTWLRFLIGNMLNPDTEITFRNVDHFVSTIEWCQSDLNRVAERPIMKTHFMCLHRFPKVIYICRDPLDSLVSYYHYCLRNNWFHDNISEFIRSDVPNYYGNWGQHVESALKMKMDRPRDILFIRYEQMLEDAIPEAGRIAQFLEREISTETISQAVARSSFSELQEMEQRSGGERTLAQKGFFRHGIARGWENELIGEDVKWIEEKYGKVMAVLGYS